MSVATWNVNGWSDHNSELRETIITKSSVDIICIVETHLTEDKDLHVPGYTWYGHNRSLKHVRAKRGSGGIGLLVRDQVYEEFTVKISNKSIDGIIALDLTHKTNDFSITVIGGYLPPENSVYGIDTFLLSPNCFSV